MRKDNHSDEIRKIVERPFSNGVICHSKIFIQIKLKNIFLIISFVLTFSERTIIDFYETQLNSGY